MDILFKYNIVAAVLVCIAALLIFGVGAAMTSEFIEDDKKEKKEKQASFADDDTPADDTPVDEAAYWSSYRRVTAVMFSLVLAFAGWCIHDNYAERAVARAYETALVALAAAIDDAAKRPFDKRCQFNGHDVAESWIASDTFPCADFGDLRLWKNSQVVVSKSSSGDGSKIFVGRREGADMKKVATYDPADWGSYGIFFERLPPLAAGTDPQAIQDLASSIHKSLR